MRSFDTDVLIVGAGPCGLGAATQLESVGIGSYLIVDGRPDVGGWASSVTTPEGFTFDHGGHVLFPHRNYPQFARALEEHVPARHLSVPKRGVWVDGELVP